MNFLVFILVSLRKTTNILDILYRARNFFYDYFAGEEELRNERRGWVVRMGCGDGLWGWVVGMGGNRRHSGGF